MDPSGSAHDCKCHVDVMWLFLSCVLPHGALGWSSVFDCGILWSYSLTLRGFRILPSNHQLTSSDNDNSLPAD